MLRLVRSPRTSVSKLRVYHSLVPRRKKIVGCRRFYTTETVERAEDEVDVCIVGAGPAGLSAAIRLKQLEKEKGNEIRVVVLEKGSEVGAHILSGAVIEPRSLNELLPDWNSENSPYPPHPLTQPALKSKMLYFTQSRTIPIPHPPTMSSKGNYIVSLSQVIRWLASIAEEHYGVEIYPGFAGAKLVYSDSEDDAVDALGRKRRRVVGVQTNDTGLSRTYKQKSTFEPGMIFRSKLTILAEGAHGSLSKSLIPYYGLRENSAPQTYGMGVKEVWRFADAEKAKSEGRYRPGEVVHSLGFPLSSDTYGGGWIYHMDDGMVSLGLVVGCDWKNPRLSPYRELQKMKHHPYFRSLLLGSGSSSGPAERIAYGGRTLTEGSYYSLPDPLHFPGGAVIGCSAGFMNVPKIKGTHGAMKSGMLAAESAFAALESSSSAPDMASYTESFKQSWLYDELYATRNIRRSFDTRLGIWGGMAWSGLDTVLFRGKWGSGKVADWLFGTVVKTKDIDGKKSTSIDSRHTKTVRETPEIVYPPFEPPLSTDLLTSVALTGTNHAEDQPVHLRVTGSPDNSGELHAEAKDGEWMYDSPESGEPKQVRREHVKTNVEDFAGLLGVACPAAVYEYVDASDTYDGASAGKKLVINSQNCIHCKLCDLKVPTQDITWTVPEGGGGPKYTVT